MNVPSDRTSFVPHPRLSLSPSHHPLSPTGDGQCVSMIFVYVGLERETSGEDEEEKEDGECGKRKKS